MRIIISFFVFCLVLFLYLHIQFHLKTSDDLEMYEVEHASKDKFEEICDIRQPVLFSFDNQKICDTTNQTYILQHYYAFEVKIRNITDVDTTNTELFVPLPIHSAIKLFQEDKNATHYSENNADFLQETGVFKNMQYNDEYLRPYMVSNCNYDILMGSEGCSTPFRYEVNYRNFFVLTQGSAQIKMAPPKSTRYLYGVYDYENFEFKSPVNPWKIQPQYAADFDKIKCLEFTLTPGKTVYIPACSTSSFPTPSASACPTPSAAPSDTASATDAAASPVALFSATFTTRVVPSDPSSPTLTLNEVDASVSIILYNIICF